MLVLSTNNRDSVEPVTVIGIRGRKGKPGFHIKHDVPVLFSALERGDVDGPSHVPKRGRTSPKGEIDRWEDDGGGAALSTERLDPSHNNPA